MFNHLIMYKEMAVNRFIGLVSRVFANGPEDWGSISSRVIPFKNGTWYLFA